MIIDRTTLPGRTAVEADTPRLQHRHDDDEPVDAMVQAAIAGLATHGTASQGPSPAELRYRLTVIIFASILLIFVAFYVTSLASGTEPEVALLRAGGASLVLAVLARVAVGILGDETRLVLNDRQIVAMAHTGTEHDYRSDSDQEHGADHAADGTEQPSMTAQAAGTGGKE
jgi:hypothetical protein